MAEKTEKQIKREIRDAARSFFHQLFHGLTTKVSLNGKSVVDEFRLHLEALYPSVAKETLGKTSFTKRVISWLSQHGECSDYDAFKEFRTGPNEVRRALLNYMDDEPDEVFYQRIEGRDTYWLDNDHYDALLDDRDKAKWEPIRKLRSHSNGSNTESS